VCACESTSGRPIQRLGLVFIAAAWRGVPCLYSQDWLLKPDSTGSSKRAIRTTRLAIDRWRWPLGLRAPGGSEAAPSIAVLAASCHQFLRFGGESALQGASDRGPERHQVSGRPLACSAKIRSRIAGGGWQSHDCIRRPVCDVEVSPVASADELSATIASSAATCSAWLPFPDKSESHKLI
jgi:hypothetical protein